MPKKTTEDGEEAVQGGIAKLDTNFYREDMNGLVDKLNEVIDAVNNL